MEDECPFCKRKMNPALDYGDFNIFISHLDFKYAVLAKILYLGGCLSVRDVIKLNVSDVFIPKNLIRFKQRDVLYPKHVLEDVKLLIQDRTSGLLFLGRQKAPLNPSTIFRNFKNAFIKAKLEKVYTPKILTTYV